MFVKAKFVWDYSGITQSQEVVFLAVVSGILLDYILSSLGVFFLGGGLPLASFFQARTLSKSG